MKPEPGTYPSLLSNYIPLVEEETVLDALEKSRVAVLTLLATVSADKENYAYAENKWTIKQLLNHIIDTERIFAYRALRFSRKDPQQPLSFEEDHYAAHAQVDHRSLAELLGEFEAVRQATITLYKSFTAPVLHYSGRTAGGETTVLALGFAICGHAAHHMRILKERYLKNNS